MEFCRMSGIKPGRFERECGLSNAYLSKLKHEPSRDKLGKIFARYPELNKDWLLNGEGKRGGKSGERAGRYLPAVRAVPVADRKKECQIRIEVKRCEGAGIVCDC